MFVSKVEFIIAIRCNQQVWLASIQHTFLLMVANIYPTSIMIDFDSNSIETIFLLIHLTLYSAVGKSMKLSKNICLIFVKITKNLGDIVFVSLNMFYHTLSLRLCLCFILIKVFNFFNQSFQVPTYIFPLFSPIDLINEGILLV